MPLTVGSRLGHYDVTALIGEGGMGQVYQATDTKLNRQVALKILPEAFASDPDRLARFQREAQVLASLNHPGIAAIYGIEESGETRALVLELVEGPTLADRISNGFIPVDEALPIAKQIAEALEAAHEAGVIHRDLKPANIKVRDDGTVKVLDFGLAKALDRAPEGDPSQSPTITIEATATGVIMGTAAYMSPEQATGRPVGRPADVWAFGCVFYEMLTSQRTFRGDSTSETLAAVLTQAVDLTALPEDLPPIGRRLLRRCLERDPRKRLRDVSESLLQVEEDLECGTTTGVSDPTPMAQVGGKQFVPIIASIVIASLVTGIAVWSITGAHPQPRDVARFRLPMAARTWADRAVAVSPESTNIVYASDRGLWLHSLSKLEATLIPGTEGATSHPFFSFDGQWVGFYADGQLKRVPIGGGAPQTVSEIQVPLGPSWSPDDYILYGQGEGGIWRVAAGGGTPELLIPVEEGESAHGPLLLPGGEWVLFTLLTPEGLGQWDRALTFVQSIASDERRVVLEAGRDARYVSTGHLVYALNGYVYGVAFDVDALETTGTPVRLLDAQVRDTTLSGAATFAVAESGSLVYIPVASDGGDERELVWVDLDGREEPLGTDPLPFMHPRISPDGSRIAVDILEGDEDIWIYSIARRTLDRLTSTPGAERNPLWSPEGGRLAFRTAGREGGEGVFWQGTSGTGQAERVSRGTHLPTAWSPDGQWLLYNDFSQTGGAGIGAFQLDEGEPASSTLLSPRRPLPSFIGNNTVSPDGRWLAFNANDETDRHEIYILPFPDVRSAGRVRLSLDGGASPVWKQDGSALFFGSPAGMMAVTVTDGHPSGWGEPEPLFDMSAYVNPDGTRAFDLHPDGDRFVMLKEIEEESVIGPHLVVVQNWTEELRRLVPVD